jgi:hypothetical protein
MTAAVGIGGMARDQANVSRAALTFLSQKLWVNCACCCVVIA